MPNLAVDGLRSLAGELAHEVYGRPSENLWLAGVTGTNGKTSCSQWIAQALNALGRKTAVIGTLGSGFPAVPGGLKAFASRANFWQRFTAPPAFSQSAFDALPPDAPRRVAGRTSWAGPVFAR